MLLTHLAAAIGAGALLAVGCGGSTPDPRPPEAPAAGQATLKVMTYNMNYGVAGDADTIAALRSGAAELVLLQETNAEWETHLRQSFASDYPHIAFRHCCTAGGVGVLSKHPFVEQEYIEPPERGWFPAWRLVVDSSLGKLQVLVVHLRPQIGDNGSVVSGYFTTPRVRGAEIEKYFARLEPKLPTIVAGDFNEQPGGRALDYLKARGYESALAEFVEDRTTWRWNTSFGKLEREFDHIVYGPGLRALSARVIDAGRSDHLPVVAVLARSRG